MKAKLITKNETICNIFFKIWMFVRYNRHFIHDSNNGEEYKHECYDNLGIIDTLGYRGSKGKYTYSHSEELGNLYGFFLPFGYKFEYQNYFSSEIYLIK
jgi:hypothetical protein